MWRSEWFHCWHGFCGCQGKNDVPVILLVRIVLVFVIPPFEMVVSDRKGRDLFCVVSDFPIGAIGNSCLSFAWVSGMVSGITDST
jgi:hypothetical protein